jgi:hypothetical protein
LQSFLYHSLSFAVSSLILKDIGFYNCKRLYDLEGFFFKLLCVTFFALKQHGCVFLHFFMSILSYSTNKREKERKKERGSFVRRFVFSKTFGLRSSFLQARYVFFLIFLLLFFLLSGLRLFLQEDAIGSEVRRPAL